MGSHGIAAATVQQDVSELVTSFLLLFSRQLSNLHHREFAPLSDPSERLVCVAEMFAFRQESVQKAVFLPVMSSS